MEERKIPDFGIPVRKISHEDGCKVYFENGGWIIARFSGTEPLLRIFCEMSEQNDAIMMCRRFEELLHLE